jgi:hypothetical protein
MMISKIKTGKYVAEYWEKMLKRQFEDGDKSVLLSAIYWCLELKRPMPEWLRVAFLDAYEAAERFRSWDEVFGRPVAKGAHLKPKRNAQLSWTIVERVEAMKAKGWKVDKELFDQVARDLKIKGVKGTYYAERGHFREFLKNSRKIS